MAQVLAWEAKKKKETKEKEEKTPHSHPRGPASLPLRVHDPRLRLARTYLYKDTPKY